MAKPRKNDKPDKSKNGKAEKDIWQKEFGDVVANKYGSPRAMMQRHLGSRSGARVIEYGTASHNRIWMARHQLKKDGSGIEIVVIQYRPNEGQTVELLTQSVIVETMAHMNAYIFGLG
jgi:hypothetical protein